MVASYRKFNPQYLKIEIVRLNLIGKVLMKEYKGVIIGSDFIHIMLLLLLSFRYI